MKKSGANVSDQKRIVQLASLGWAITDIANELGLTPDMVRSFAPDNELRTLHQTETDIQNKIDARSQALSEAIDTTQAAQGELPAIRALLTAMQRELTRAKEALTKTSRDKKRIKQQLLKAEVVVADALDVEQGIKDDIDTLKGELVDAEEATAIYDASIQEKKRIQGVDIAKLRQASEIAAMVIENTVGEKIERLIKERL